MKRLRRFWRRNAGLLGVLCGVVLLLAAVLYLNSGQPVRMVLAEPTPEPVLIYTLPPMYTPEPGPSPVPTPTYYLYTPCPEAEYDAMCGDVRGWNGMALPDMEKVDFSVPPPGTEVWSASPTNPDFYDDWSQYLRDEIQYVEWDGWVVNLYAIVPESVLKKYPSFGNSHGHDVRAWEMAIEQGRETLEKQLLNIEEIDFSKEPARNDAYSQYDDLPKETWNRYVWLGDLQYETIIWGDWIIQMCDPPPGYDVSKDPLKELGYDDETIVHFRDGGTWGTGDGYGDAWEKFFEENPDMLYID